MLASSSAEKAIRKLAKARIQSSPQLRRQYWMARGGWRYWGLWITAATASTFVIPLLLFVFPGTGGWQLTECRDRTEGLASITMAAFVAAVVALIHGNWLRRELTRSTSMALLGQLPISDLGFLRNRTALSLGLSLVFLIVCLAYAAGIALGGGFGASEIGMLLGLGIAEWLMVAATSILIPMLLPQVARGEVAGGLVVLLLAFAGGAIVAWGLGLMQLPAAEVVLDVILKATPTGWPLLMMLDGIVQPQAGTWWLAIPVGLAVVAAAAVYFWLERSYIIREVTIENGMIGIAVGEKEWQILNLETDDSTTAEVDPSLLARLQRRFNVEPETDDDEISPAEASMLVRDGDFLEREQWTSAGFVERLIASVLSDRERLAVELMTGNSPSWTKSLVLGTTTSLAVVALLLLIDQAFQIRLIAMGGHVAFFGLISTLNGTWKAALWKSSNGQTCSSMSVVPISQSEAERVSMVLGAVRAFCLLPFAIGLTTLLFFGLTGQAEFFASIYIGAKVALAYAALHQWWFVVIQINVQAPFPSAAWFADLLVAGLCFVLTLAGAVGLFVAAQSEVWSLAAATAMFGGGWLAQRYQHRRILNDPTDFAGSQSGSFRLDQQLRSR